MRCEEPWIDSDMTIKKGLTCSFNGEKCMMQMDYWLLIRQRTTLQEEVRKL